jgi:signal transduction histidine kinase
VIGYTQTLQIRAAREGHLSRRDQDTLRMIAAQAKRLHTLLDSILDLARLRNGQRRFYRARNLDPRQMQGTGIGLSIVAEIVALHGGVVEIDSAKGQSSTFTVRLPLPQAHSTAQSTQAIDHRQSVPPTLAAQQLERPAMERYQEQVH